MWMPEILLWSKKRQGMIKKDAFIDTRQTYFPSEIK